MSVQTFSHEEAIQVTALAAKHFQMQLQRSGRSAIRLSLKESGCTGYKYVIDEVNEAAVGDLSVKLDNGVVVFVAPDNLKALQGTVVDYVQQGLNFNLVMNNPNVADSCGCGESFSFKQE